MTRTAAQDSAGPDPLTGMRDNWAEHGRGTGLTDLLRGLGSPPPHRRFGPNGGSAVAEAWRPSMGRLGRRMLGSGGQRPGLPGVRGHGEAFAVVDDLQRLAVQQLVLCGVAVYGDAQPPAAIKEAEAELGQPGWQPGRERQRLVVVAHAAEAGYRGEPGAGKCGDVQAVARVVREVA